MDDVLRGIRSLLLAALLTLIGCGPSSSPITLRIGTWGAASDDSEFQRTTRELYREFEASHPGVRVRIEGVPGSQEYVSKMLLSFIAGTEPDVITLDASSAAVFIDNGVLLDLESFARRDRDFSFDDYFPNVVEIARRGERVYAVPIDFTPMVMYYNKRLFDQSGVPYPKPGWTYEEFVQTAKRLTNGQVYGFRFANWMPGWVTWLWNNGGDVLTPDGKSARTALDSPESVSAIRFIQDMISVHKISPSLSQTASLGVDPFTNGLAAMEINGHWALVGYSVAPKGPDGKPLLSLDDVGVVELPTNLPKSVTVMYEAGFAIGKNCRHPQTAWEFIKFMTSAHAQRRLNRTGIAVSARKDVAAERGRLDEREREFLRIVPSARPPWGSKVEGYDNVEVAGQKMMDNVLLGSLTLEQAVKRAVAEIDEDFRKR